jgi:hypothetical protein
MQKMIEKLEKILVDVSKYKHINFSIENTTNQTIKNVELINHDFDKQKKLKYVGNCDFYTYKDILIELIANSHKDITIEQTLFHIVGNGSVFKKITLAYKEYGQMSQYFRQLAPDTEQHLKDVVLYNEKFNWGYGTSIVIDELEPNCTLRVNLQLKN